MTGEAQGFEDGGRIAEDEIIQYLRIYGPEDPVTGSLLREYRHQEQDLIGSSPENFLTLDFRLDKLYRRAGTLPVLRMVESHLTGLLARIEAERVKDENRDVQEIFERLAKDVISELASVKEEITKI